jgi:hypothetical protein
LILAPTFDRFKQNGDRPTTVLCIAHCRHCLLSSRLGSWQQQQPTNVQFFVVLSNLRCQLGTLAATYFLKPARLLFAAAGSAFPHISVIVWTYSIR